MKKKFINRGLQSHKYDDHSHKTTIEIHLLEIISQAHYYICWNMNKIKTFYAE